MGEWIRAYLATRETLFTFGTAAITFFLALMAFFMSMQNGIGVRKQNATSAR
jgi:hypothetical protein